MRKVEAYETKDGRLFKDIHLAEKHELGIILNGEIDEMIEKTPAPIEYDRELCIKFLIANRKRIYNIFDQIRILPKDRQPNID